MDEIDYKILRELQFKTRITNTELGLVGAFPGGLNRVHQISVDSSGNLFIAGSDNNRVEKFRPRVGADKGRPVGQFY
jgi:hypothetical protein